MEIKVLDECGLHVYIDKEPVFSLPAIEYIEPENIEELVETIVKHTINIMNEIYAKKANDITAILFSSEDIHIKNSEPAKTFTGTKD